VLVDGKPTSSTTASAPRERYRRHVPRCGRRGRAGSEYDRCGRRRRAGHGLGLWQLHHRFGRLTWRAELAPAIHYAHDGFRVSRLLTARRDHFAAELHGRTNFLLYFGALATDATFRQPELESTLRRIAARVWADSTPGVPRSSSLPRWRAATATSQLLT